MGEFGVYDLTLDADGDCPVDIALKPVHANLALLYSFLILLLLGIVFRIYVFLDNRGYLDKLKAAVQNLLRELGFEVSQLEEHFFTDYK